MNATITTSVHHYFREGDRVSMVGDSNRVRTRVSRQVSSTVFEIEKNYRPSRGFARHVRLLKQRRRR